MHKTSGKKKEVYVYIKDIDGSPLMPTKRHGWVRRALRDGKARVLKRTPFTIQLLYDSERKLQDIDIYIDGGYESIGVSAQTNNKEVLGGTVEMLKGMSARLQDRAMYRSQRRSRCRYRRPKFKKGGNFQTNRPHGWLAPSIQHKLNTHIQTIRKIKEVLPVSRVILETASFDIQKINNPNIEAVEYQRGVQMGFWNLREYVLYRDQHRCQNTDCKNTAKEIILQVHHLGFWKGDRSDRPDNLITLCTQCHSPRNHQKSGFLYGWEPSVKRFRGETFMTTVRKKLLSDIQKTFDVPVKETFGYITKQRRIERSLPKSHHHDAFAMGNAKDISHPFCIKQTRRNNRSLERFYDAKYLDTRDKSQKSGMELSSGRRTRNKNSSLNSDNLRPFRGHKTRDGKRAIRHQRYPLQPGDIVRFEGEICVVKGTHTKGKIVRFITKNGKTKDKSVKKVEPVVSMKGIGFALI